MKRPYQGPYEVFVHSYLGNVSASFAVYFLATIATALVYGGWRMSAAAALLVVEAFELTNGFGVMSNTYDPWDLLANAVGILLALGASWAFEVFPERTPKLHRKSSESRELKQPR